MTGTPKADCLVVNQVSRTQPAPENSGGSPTNQVLISLNCDSGEASAKTPGFSAASPEGKAAAAAASSSAAAASASAATLGVKLNQLCSTRFRGWWQAAT